MTTSSNLRLKRSPPAGLTLLLTVQFFLGLLRISIVPLGHNVDEIWHFHAAVNVVAGCLRQTLGMSWAYFDDDRIPLADVQRWELDPGNPDAAPCTALFGPHKYARSLVYYLYVGVPAALANTSDFERTAAVARLATLALGLSTSGLVYYTSLELYPSRWLLALGSAAAVGLNHHFADIMTGVNNDAAAIFVVTLLLWALTRVRRQPDSPRRWWVVVLALTLGPFTKPTAWVGFPIALIWLWSVLSVRIRWGTGAAVLLLALAGGAGLFANKHRVTAHWFASTAGIHTPVQPADRTHSASLLGEYALRVDANTAPDGVVQFFPESQLDTLRGQRVTVGGWISMPGKAEVAFPAVQVGDRLFSAAANSSTNWEFHALSMTVPADAEHLAVILPPSPDGGTVLYDGLTLVIGEFSAQSSPQFDSAAAAAGEWDGERFTNLLRNPSAEQTWPAFLSILKLPSLPPVNFPLWSLLSWARTAQAWLQIPVWLFVMYWSGFGGVSPGLTRTQMMPFAGLSLLAGVGLLWALLRHARSERSTLHLRPDERTALWLLIATAALIWSTVIMRADIYPDRAVMFAFVGTRYGLTGMFPTTGLFMLGLFIIFPRRWQRWLVGGLTLLLFFTSVYILLIVQVPFHNCPDFPQTICLSSVQ